MRTIQGTPEWREKIAVATRLAMHQPEIVLKVSAAQSKRWSDPKEREAQRQRKLGHKPSAETRKKMRISQRRRIRTGRVFHSKLELRARFLLKEFGLDNRVYFSNYAFDGGDSDRKIVVEVDGCWVHDHRCNGRKGHPDGRLRNRLRKRLAESKGFDLIVLRECGEQDWAKSLRRF